MSDTDTLDKYFSKEEAEDIQSAVKILKAAGDEKEKIALYGFQCYSDGVRAALKGQKLAEESA